MAPAFWGIRSGGDGAFAKTVYCLGMFPRECAFLCLVPFPVVLDIQVEFHIWECDEPQENHKLEVVVIPCEAR